MGLYLSIQLKYRKKNKTKMLIKRRTHISWNACDDEKIKIFRFFWLLKCWTKTEFSECFLTRSWSTFCHVEYVTD